MVIIKKSIVIMLKNILVGIIVLFCCSGSYSQEVNEEKVLKDILPEVLKNIRLVIVRSPEFSKKDIPDSIIYDTALLKNNPKKYQDKIAKWEKENIRNYNPDSVDCLKKDYTYVLTVFDTLYEMPNKKLNSLYERISKIDSLNEYSSILSRYIGNNYKDKKNIEFDSVRIGDCYLTVNKRLTEDNFYKYGDFYLHNVMFSNIYINDKEDRAVIICAYSYATHLSEYYICLKRKNNNWKIECLKKI